MLAGGFTVPETDGGDKTIPSRPQHFHNTSASVPAAPAPPTVIPGLGPEVVPTLQLLPTGPIKFDRQTHMTVGEGDRMEPYRSRRNDEKKTVRWGQLKLLMTEIQFLTLYWDPVAVPEPHVVYAGAAPGTHLVTLSRMFPQATFHLYDPRDFDPQLRDLPQIRLYQQLFTDEDARKWAGRQDVFFISDVRSLTYDQSEQLDETKQRANEAAAWENMEMQQRWVQIIRPVRAHLKFRLPYGYAFVKAAGLSRPYLDGLVYLQPWTRETSTECRLVPYPDLRMRDWDYLAQEAMMFYHNVRIREGQTFLSPLSGRAESIDPRLGLTDDWDSALTTVILQDYLAKFGESSPSAVMALAAAVIDGAGGGRASLIALRNRP